LKICSSFKIFILGFCFVLTSCGQNEEKEVQSAIVSAVLHLTNGDCDKAIESINSIAYQHKDSKYIKTYASAYACRAGFSTPRFFASDLEKIGDPSTLGGHARFSTSPTMIEPRHESFEDMQIAVDALLYAGGIERFREPTIARRAAQFSSRELLELHSQLFYFTMAQLGRYLFYYGNARDGIKGDGVGINGCFANYTGAVTLNLPPPVGNTDIASFLGTGVTGSCVWGAAVGHPQLGITGSLNVQRMCQGVVLLNNMLELLPVILNDISGDEFGEIRSISGLLDDAQEALSTISPTAEQNIFKVMSQESCVEKNTDDTSDLQRYFAFMFETLME